MTWRAPGPSAPRIAVEASPERCGCWTLEPLARLAAAPGQWSRQRLDLRCHYSHYSRKKRCFGRVAKIAAAGALLCADELSDGGFTADLHIRKGRQIL
jgi:hypothetical protein